MPENSEAFVCLMEDALGKGTLYNSAGTVLLNLGHGKLKKVMENHRILKASKSMNLVLIVITKFMDIVIWLAKCFLSLLKVCE